MSNRSPAKMLASSPPAAPRISTITFFSSLGSCGRSKTSNSFSRVSFSCSKDDISSLANSCISGSFNISLAVSISDKIVLYLL